MFSSKDLTNFLFFFFFLGVLLHAQTLGSVAALYFEEVEADTSGVGHCESSTAQASVRVSGKEKNKPIQKWLQTVCQSYWETVKLLAYVKDMG